jgi:patatin-like phospholipase/acyl hydrolase
MLVPNEKGTPKYYMGDIIDLYYKFGSDIFTANTQTKIKSLWGLIGPKYPSKNIENTFLETFDHYKISELLKPCLFTAYDITERRANIYTNFDENKKYKDMFIKDIVRGSTCVPSFFPPAYFTDNTYIHTIVDGGVYAANPSMVTYVEISKTWFGGQQSKLYTPKDVTFVSLGTGLINDKSYTYKKTKKWGKAQWMIPAIDIMMSSQCETVNYEIGKLFDGWGASDNYHRLEPNLVFGNYSFIDASEKNLDNLVQDTKNYIMEHHDELDTLAKKLCYEEEV